MVDTGESSPIFALDKVEGAIQVMTFHRNSRQPTTVMLNGLKGFLPDAEYLCTPMAKMPDIIEWGSNRSLMHRLPDQPFGLSMYEDRAIMLDGI